jgi:ribonuclease J
MLGVDAIIPDYQYVLDNRERITAVLVTHGHEDHVGALPYLMRDIDAPIYATPLTNGLIEVKLREAKLLEKVTLKTIEAGFNFRLGSFNIEPFHVAHSIPDCVGFGITTPVGLIVHTGDYKFDHTPVDNWPPDFAKLAEFSQRGVLALLADSTNAERPGWTPSEKVITAAFDELFRQADGRIIIASFASLISRIQQVAEVSARYGRKLAITGRSMRSNAKMASRLGYLDIPDELLIDISEAAKLPAHRVTIMATGSQGEPTAVLGRLATGRHRQLSIQEGDTVVLSAHPIPGNEEMIHRIINRLFQRGAEVFYDGTAHVHVSGHASREEMKLMINLVRPKFLIPIHGELRHLKQHARMARELGMAPERIAVVENGTVLELDEHSLNVTERLPGGYVYIDGAGVGDVGESILREREKLADGGFVVTVVSVSSLGDLIGKPQFISHGFTNLEQSNGLLTGAEETLAETASLYWQNKSELRRQMSAALSRYFYNQIGRRPVVDVVLR